MRSYRNKIFFVRSHESVFNPSYWSFVDKLITFFNVRQSASGWCLRELFLPDPMEAHSVMKCWVLVILVTVLPAAGFGQSSLSADASGSHIVAAVQKMTAALESVEGFRCEADIRYYRHGKADKRFIFTLHAETQGSVSLAFSRPYPGVKVVYRQGDNKLTIKPFQFLPIVSFSLSIDNPLVKSPSGQRIDHCTLEYLITFLHENGELISKRASEYREGKERVEFICWAKDYTDEKELNRYRVVVLKENWFPSRVERYNQQNLPIEIISFKNYTIDLP
jgi:outer membrane lipoprotein-sorting protein